MDVSVSFKGIEGTASVCTIFLYSQRVNHAVQTAVDSACFGRPHWRGFLGLADLTHHSPISEGGFPIPKFWSSELHSAAFWLCHFATSRRGFLTSFQLIPMRPLRKPQLAQLS